VSDLKEFEVIGAALVSLESSSDHFHLSPDIDEGFRLLRSRDPWVFDIAKHAIENRIRSDVHTFLLRCPGFCHKCSFAKESF
jgi:hypothetical protein